MAWPLAQDFNEAIQNPSSAFSDPDLKAGKVTTTPAGVPMPRSGNYADVYQVIGPEGKGWAVKCFTRAVPADLKDRYSAIAKHLAEANLPFTVGFDFLTDGILVKGKQYPAVKMQWVEGQAINAFVKDNLNKATLLEAMLSLWVRLCRRLRESGMAHADLQHGNVILVPGQTQNSLGLKLVDYDGMFVPALAGKPPGEAGHASYQHPERIKTNNYSADLDRFPHLVVATALRGLLVGGKALWEKYDTGDNLLFTAKDFTNPSQSKAMRELWDSGDPFAVGLLSHLVIAAAKPLAQTPWLDTLMPEGRAPVLTPSQEKQAMKLLGIPVQGAVPAAVSEAAPGGEWGEVAQPRKSRPAVAPKPAETPDLAFEPESIAEIRGSRRTNAVTEKKSQKALYALIAGGLALIAVAIGVFAFAGKKNKGGETVAQTSGSSSEVKPPEPPTKSSDSNTKAPLTPTPPEKAPESPTAAALKIGKLVWSKNVGADAPKMVHYSLDGSKIIVPFWKTGQIRVYDVRTGEQTATFKDHAPIDRVVAAPLPGGKVVSMGKEPVMMVWDDATGKALARIPVTVPAEPILKLQTEPSGRYILFTTWRNATLIDADQQKEVLTFPIGGELQKSRATGYGGAILSQDGTKILAVTPDHNLKIIPVPGGAGTTVKLKFTDSEMRINDWNADGHIAILKLSYEKACTVDTATGEKLVEIPSYEGHAVLSADGAYVIASSHSPDDLVFLDPRTGAVKAKVPTEIPMFTKGIAGSPDRGTAAFVTSFEGKDEIAVVESPFGGIRMAIVKPAPPKLPSEEPKAPGELGEIVNLLTLSDAELTDSAVTCVAMSAECRNFAYCDANFLHVMAVADKAVPIFKVPLPEKTIPRGVWFLANNDVLVELRQPKGTVELRTYNGTTGKEDRTFALKGLDVPSKLVLNSGGTHAAVVRPNGQTTVYDLATLKMVVAENPHVDGPPLDVLTVSVALSTPCTKMAITRMDRLQKYTLSNMNSITTYPLKNAMTVDDVTDDILWAAFRETQPDDPNRVSILFRQLGERWKDKVIAVSVNDPTTHLRFLVKDSNQAFFVTKKIVQICDTTTGGPIGEGMPHPPNMKMIGLAPGREGFILGGPASICLFVPKNLVPAVVAKAPAAAKDGRKPVPDDETLKKTEAMLRDSLKDLYAKKTPADRRKLAESVLKIGIETKTDDNAKYWLLNEARSVAAEIGDPALGNKAIDAIDKEFSVDGSALRISLLEKTIAGVNDTHRLKLLAENCAEMLEDSAEANDYDKAIKIASLGLSALSRSNQQASSIGKDFEARLAQLRRQKETFEAVKPAFDAIALTPDDAAANLAVGKYRCFTLGRWAEGMPNLAAGSDPALKKLAALDLGTGAEAKPLKKAEAWWNWAQAQNEADRAAPLTRARYWYANAIADGLAGIDKFTAESRLSFTSGVTEYRPGLLLEIAPIGGLASAKKTIKLLPTPTLSAENYKALPGSVINVKLSGIIVPPTPGRYRIALEGRAIARVSLFPKPDDKILFSPAGLPAAAVRRDATVVLPNKPVAFLLEATLATAGANATPVNSFMLKWTRPGTKTEELLPADAFFHKKSEESTLTEK